MTIEPKLDPAAPALVEKDSVKVESEVTIEPVAMYRIQPDEPYWLQTNSPASYVPSLGAQMARRLGALGVRHVSDLIDLDPEITDVPLTSLQISARTLRIWQAEARLLCCVPDLTGRDAQLLVACGIMNPAELGEADTNDLFKRIERARNEHHSGGLTWLADRPNWPQRDVISNWIHRGRSARSYSQARDWSSQRRQHFSSRSDSTSRTGSQRTWKERASRTRTDRGHTSHEDRIHSSRSRSRSRSARTDREHFIEQEVSDSTDREWRFYLHMDSPVVDAPTIGPRMADRLAKIGVTSVSDLVNRDAAEIVNKLQHKRTSFKDVIEWQQQAELVCRIPQLRGHDAQVLVACGVNRTGKK